MEENSNPCTPAPFPAVSVYSNDLFTDGEEHGQPSSSYASNRPQAPGSAQKMQQQKSSLAARRAERMQANIYQSNVRAFQGAHASSLEKKE